MTERPLMRCNQRARFLLLINMLGFTAGLCATPSFAGDITLVSIGPRIGFGEKIPFMGKEQKHYVHLYDIAAIVKLPWSWPLGGGHMGSGDETDRKRGATDGGK